MLNSTSGDDFCNVLSDCIESHNLVLIRHFTRRKKLYFPYEMVLAPYLLYKYRLSPAYDRDLFIVYGQSIDTKLFEFHRLHMISSVEKLNEQFTFTSGPIWQFYPNSYTIFNVIPEFRASIKDCTKSRRKREDFAYQDYPGCPYCFEIKGCSHLLYEYDTCNEEFFDGKCVELQEIFNNIQSVFKEILSQKKRILKRDLNVPKLLYNEWFYAKSNFRYYKNMDHFDQIPSYIKFLQYLIVNEFSEIDSYVTDYPYYTEHNEQYEHLICFSRNPEKLFIKLKEQVTFYLSSFSKVLDS